MGKETINGMNINIYTSNNGVGLQADAIILSELLISKGYKVKIVDRLKRETGLPASEIGLHLEHAIYTDFHKNKKNFFIPNPEWCDKQSQVQLNRFNAILCKTKHCETIFSQLHTNVFYSGFTSFDHYDKSIKKDLILFHLQGKSQMKNTNVLIDIYRKDKTLPVCYSVSSHNAGKYNNLLFTGRQSQRDLKTLLNACLIHVCPSQYEGFGHYINEARSVGAVVITTDAAPMNEFIKDNRLLVKTEKGITHHLAVLNNANSYSLEYVIKNVVSLPYKELIEIGKQNRIVFLKNDREFKERFIKLIKCQ